MLNSEAATSQAAAPVGRIASFGKYLLLQRVSVGGMAEVFKAIPEGATRIDQIVAIKRILPNIAEDREFIGMFIDEARIAGQLTHPNICRIYELGRVGADHYIAMQFLWGRDLLKVMNRFKRAGLLIPPPMAVFIAAHAAGALHYAHNKRDASGAPLHIIHRDVSPQNIIVGYSGQAKLIDFGVARAASQSQKTQAGILKGKFGYMSPEMIRGLPVDHRSDVFAMGICLHEALTGSRLFYGETDFATLELVRDAKILPPSSKAPGVPPELDAIVIKALSRDADTRYQSANEFAEALEGFLDRFHPGYGEAEVGAAMREAFANELSREKLRLDAFAGMLERGELVRGAALPVLPNDPPPSGERSAAPSERPPSSQSNPRPEVLAAEAEHGLAETTELSEQQTQIFFSANELNELRHLDAPAEPAWRPPAPSEVIMRPSSGLTAPPPMPAPSFATLSGTHPRLFDEGARRGPVTAPLSGRRHEDGNRTQPIRTQDDSTYDMALQRADRHRGTVRSSLLAAAALALAALGYSAVSAGTRRTANLAVAASGAQAALVRVDGVVRGNAPLSVEALAPGAHEIEVEAPGYEPARVRVSVEAGATRQLNLQLVRAGAPSVDALAQGRAAGAAVDATPSDATPIEQGVVPNKALRLPGKPMVRPGVRPRLGTVAAAPDAQEVPAESPDTVGLESTTEVAPAPSNSDEPVAVPAPTGETQVGETINEEAASAGEGELLISTVPWSRVIIDGTDTGRDTPVRALRVAAGDHTILLRTPEGQEHSVQVSVVAGKTVRIIRRF